MKLDEVPSGSVYIDTNVLYMYLRADPAHLPTIRTFLGRMVHGDIEAFVGVAVLDELFYRLLLARVKEATLPRDALHVASIQRLGLTAIASDDTDFDRVEGLERHWVINPPEGEADE